VLELLRRHQWPGNVRELRNVIERAVVLCTGDVVLPDHLPPSLRGTDRAGGTPAAAPGAQPGDGRNLQTEMKALERARIIEALERCHGNQSEAARQLGMPRRTLVTRLSEFGLTRSRRRADGG